MAENELEDSEESARESLAILDDLLLEGPPADRKKFIPPDNWLTGQEAVTSTLLWIRRATVENQVCLFVVLLLLDSLIVV